MDIERDCIDETLVVHGAERLRLPKDGALMDLGWKYAKYNRDGSVTYYSHEWDERHGSDWVTIEANRKDFERYQETRATPDDSGTIFYADSQPIRWRRKEGL